MKKASRILIAVGVLAVVMIATVPSPDEHRAMLREKMDNIVNQTEKWWVNRWISKQILHWEVKDMPIQNSLFFNLSYCMEKKERKYISIGMFNHVFFIPHKEYFED